MAFCCATIDGAGPVVAQYAGGVAGRYFLVLTGDPIRQMAAAEAAVGLALMGELARAAPEQRLFEALTREDGSPSGFLKAIGLRRLAEHLAANKDPADLAVYMDVELDAFRARREQYLIYR